MLSKYLVGCHLEEYREEFQLTAEDWTHNNGLKLRTGMYQLDIRILSGGWMNACQRCSRPILYWAESWTAWPEWPFPTQ